MPLSPKPVVFGWIAALSKTAGRASPRPSDSQVSVATVCRCVNRHHELGETGMADRSSRPHHIPHGTPPRTERRTHHRRLRRPPVRADPD